MESLRRLWDQLGERLGLVAVGEGDEAEILQLAASEGEFEIEVARSGRFTSMSGQEVNLTPKRLAELADTFEPSVFRPVNKLGHPDVSKTDTPSYGPITGVRYDQAADRLFVKTNPNAELRQHIKDKRFTERSIEFTPNYRGTKKARLLGLGWLGATPPAIDGLAALCSPLDSDATFLVMADAKHRVGEPEDDENLVYYFRQFTADERKKAAKEGAALPDGSYPIYNQDDLDNAIQAIGRASDPGAAKAHIRKRAKALGLKLPDTDTWKTKAAAQGRAEDDEMGNDDAIKLADVEKTVERLRGQIKTGAQDRAKAFMAANVKRIPMQLVKGGFENFLTALFAMDAEDEKVIKFAGGDGKEVSGSISESVTKMLALLPEQVRREETTELADKGGDEDEPEDRAQAFAGEDVDDESVKVHFAVQKEIADAKAKGEEITYLQGVQRVERAKARTANRAS